MKVIIFLSAICLFSQFTNASDFYGEKTLIQFESNIDQSELEYILLEGGFTGKKCGPRHHKTGHRRCCWYDDGEQTKCVTEY